MTDPISMEDWIIVPKWTQFQHYKDRNPPWIKVYTRLLQKPEFLELSAASRGVLVTIWLLYGAENGPVRVSSLTHYGRKLASYHQLISLNRAGFIELRASTALAPSTEVEKEKETPLTPLTAKNAQRKLENEAFELALDWKTGSSEDFHKELDTLEQVLRGKLSALQRMRLIDLISERGRT